LAKVLERIEQLMALATSPNDNEARNAALLAVQLIRKHKVKLELPAGARSTPMPGPRSTPQPAKRSRSSSKGVKRVVDPPEKIVAPLGGECVHCGHRYRAETTIYWFSSGGGMHVKCFEDWSQAKR
jgi:hypothetical protein